MKVTIVSEGAIEVEGVAQTPTRAGALLLHLDCRQKYVVPLVATHTGGIDLHLTASPETLHLDPARPTGPTHVRIDDLGDDVWEAEVSSGRYTVTVMAVVVTRPARPSVVDVTREGT